LLQIHPTLASNPSTLASNPSTISHCQLLLQITHQKVSSHRLGNYSVHLYAVAGYETFYLAIEELKQLNSS
jgi:hypothetical protein